MQPMVYFEVYNLSRRAPILKRWGIARCLEKVLLFRMTLQ